MSCVANCVIDSASTEFRHAKFGVQATHDVESSGWGICELVQDSGGGEIRPNVKQNST